MCYFCRQNLIVLLTVGGMNLCHVQVTNVSHVGQMPRIPCSCFTLGINWIYLQVFFQHCATTIWLKRIWGQHVFLSLAPLFLFSKKFVNLYKWMLKIGIIACMLQTNNNVWWRGCMVGLGAANKVLNLYPVGLKLCILHRLFYCNINIPESILVFSVVQLASRKVFFTLLEATCFILLLPLSE